MKSLKPETDQPGRDISEEKAHEHEIARLRREAELERHRLQELLRQAPAAIGLISGPEHRWTYVNDLYVQVTGRKSLNDFLGKTVLESLPELEGQGFMELLDDVYRTGTPFFGREMRVNLRRSAAGQLEETYWDFSYQPVRDTAGHVESILVHAVEVSDRAIARRTLEQSEERFRAIVDTTPECVMVVAAEGTLLYMNSSGLAVVGADRLDTIEGKNIYDLIAAEDRERFREFNQRICRGEKGSLEFDVIGLRGVRRQMETHAAPLHNAAGSIVQLAVTRDISSRKQAEEAQRRLAAIVESSDDAIASKDLNGIVTSWNRSAERLFGYKAEEMIGQPIMLIIPPELHPDEDMILRKIRRGEKIDHFETVRLTKDGERVDVSLTISPVKDEHGKIIGAAKIVRDITETKKIEGVLRTTEKLAAAGRLAATVAHEINNPLEAVTNLVYLAKRDLNDSEKVGAHLELAGRELERIAHIARQTLGFYRDTSSPIRFNVVNILDDLLLLYESRLETRHIRVVKQYEEQEIELTGIAGEIRQAFSNMITNAIDAMPTGGWLVIRVSKSHEWGGSGRPGVRITFLDTGSGITRQSRKNLFQPFFTTKKDIGTGLGLWITRSIVEKHGGTIRVKSKTGPNQHGTVFSIFLPLNVPSESLEEGQQADARSRVA